MKRRLRRAFAVSTALAMGLLGCELIVSSTVPDFRCTPGAPAACPSGQTCDPVARVCVVGTTGEGGTIDSTDGRDTGKDGPDDPDGGNLARLGEPCAVDRPCGSTLICATSNLLTTAILATTTEAICTKTCCTSDDCGEGFVCFGSGTGGNYCVSTERAERGPLGDKGPGAACDEASECRSGVCADGFCLDTCCSADECGGATTCRVKTTANPPPARENWVCAPTEPDAALNTGSGCSQTTQRCKNDNCTGFPLKCRPACCNSKQCVTLHSSFGYCAYGEFTTTGSQTKWCFDKNDASAGQRALGEPCNGNGDCALRFCDPDSKTCAAVCCEDSDCEQGEVCRPSASGTPFLRCVTASSLQ